MKFRVPSLLGGRTYTTWEDAKNNCKDVNDITVELNGSEYVNLHNTYFSKIELLKNQTIQLQDMLNKKDFEYQQNINELESDL